MGLILLKSKSEEPGEGIEKFIPEYSDMRIYYLNCQNALKHMYNNKLISKAIKNNIINNSISQSIDNNYSPLKIRKQ